MAPPLPSFPRPLKATEDANRYPPISFSVRPEHVKMLETLARSVVVHDLEGKGASFIEINLTRAFYLPGWQWIARSIPGGRFLIEAPNEQWRRTAIKRKFLNLGEINFPVESFQPRHNIRPEPTLHQWVNIRGLPYELWKDFEFVRIAKELGGFLLDVDPVSKAYIDFTILRLKIGVPDINVIPLGRHLLFDTPTGPRFFFLDVEIDCTSNMNAGSGWGVVGGGCNSRSYVRPKSAFGPSGSKNAATTPPLKCGNSGQQGRSSTGNTSHQSAGADTSSQEKMAGAQTVTGSEHSAGTGSQVVTAAQVGDGSGTGVSATQCNTEADGLLVCTERGAELKKQREKFYDDGVHWDRVDPAVVNPQKIVLMRKITTSDSGKTMITYVPPDELIAAKQAALEAGSPSNSEAHLANDEDDNLSSDEMSDVDKSRAVGEREGCPQDADGDGCGESDLGKRSFAEPVSVSGPRDEEVGDVAANGRAPSRTYVKKSRGKHSSAESTEFAEHSGEDGRIDPTGQKRKWDGAVHCLD